MADNRSIDRIKKRMSLHFGLDDAVRVAFSEDISLTGMFIKTPNVVPPNSRIKIMFILHDGSRVEVEARVMWAKKVPANLFHLVKKSGMGVRFLHFQSGEESFNNFIEHRATSFQ